MNNSYIISKMNEFMFQLNGKMGAWLSKKLPMITDNWWQELVVNIRKMQEVRNSWAHITSSAISKEKVIADVDTIIALMQAFDASMKETRDMENFIFDVEEDKEMKPEEDKTIIVESSEPEMQTTGGIEVGDDSLAERAHGADARMAFAFHQMSFVAHCYEFVGAGVEGYYRRLVYDDFIVVYDNRIGSAKVDCNFFREREKSHLMCKYWNVNVLAQASVSARYW